MVIAFPSTPSSNIYDNYVLPNTTINLCRLADGFIGNFLMQGFMENRKNHTNFELKCPLPKGNYYYKDFPMSTEFMPKLLTDTRFKLTITLKVQTQKNVRLKDACSTITVGEFFK